MIKTYYPACLTLIFIACLSAYTAFIRTPFGDFSLFLQDGLGFFFCLFAYFKLLDIKGFQQLFIRYDIVAKRFPIYGYIYPFIELIFGLCFLLSLIPLNTLCVLTILFILFRGIGIVKASLSRENIPCGCMGTTALFPINWTTILANIVTVFAAVILISQ